MAVSYQPRKFAKDSAAANLSQHRITEMDIAKAPDDYKQCSIWETYEVNGVVVFLPCFHCFHDACIRSNFQQNTRCPLCNTDFHQVVQQAEDLLEASERE